MSCMMKMQNISKQTLEKENQDLREQISSLQNDHSSLQNEHAYVKEQLEWLKRQVFGKKSERVVREVNEEQLLFDGFESLFKEEKKEKQKVPAHERKKPVRNGQDKIKLPPDLPVERQVIDVPEKERTCPKTGKPFKKIGEEVSCKLCYKPGSYFLKEIVRPKYALDEKIITASLPDSLLERCQADESLLADLLCKKYADHLPLYRIQEILSREGIHISRQTLCQWVYRSGEALKVLYDEIKKRLLASKNVFADEVPVPLQVKGKGKLQKAYMWVVAGGRQADPPYRIYGFYPDRKHDNAFDILKAYKGVLHSDKYGAYQKLAKEEGIIWCPCYVHIRRKFFEAQSGNPKIRDWILRKIRYLFMFEKVAWARSEKERLRIRKEKEEPIIDEMIETIKKELVDGKHLPKSKFKEALGYFQSSVPYLKNYMKDPFARLDNNVAERAVRPLVIGRKNWMFIGSEKNGKSAAIIFSLIQSCRALKVNPRSYLEDIMRRLMTHHSQKLVELLPHEWAKTQSSKIS